MSKIKNISLDQIGADNIPAPEYDQSSEHPTPEHLFLREAIKHLTAKQREVWELHIYDKLSSRAIAKKLNKSRTTIMTQLKQCEARIKKWCDANMAAYRVIRHEMGRE